MSYRFADSLRAGSANPLWHMPLLCVQWKTLDDGRRNCPKHVELYSKNKFQKLVHLVGFIVRNVYQCLPASNQYNTTIKNWRSSSPSHHHYHYHHRHIAYSIFNLVTWSSLINIWEVFWGVVLGVAWYFIMSVSVHLLAMLYSFVSVILNFL